VVVPLKTYKSNVIHHEFVQFGKQHSRYKTIMPVIVLSQQCLPYNLTGWIRP